MQACKQANKQKSLQLNKGFNGQSLHLQYDSQIDLATVFDDFSSFRSFRAATAVFLAPFGKFITRRRLQ